METGRFVKMKFTSYPDDKFDAARKRDGEDVSYSVMINPSSIKRSLVIKYVEEQPKGSDSSDMKYKSTSPESWSFDFIIDGTGLSSASSDGKETRDDDHEIVKREIEQFLDIVYYLDGNIHRPFFVIIEYSGLRFQCVLSNVDIHYSLFYPDGMPLRAKLSCVFQKAVNKEQAAIEEAKESPDMTHLRVLKEGEPLISKVYDIYKNIDYYGEVARKNDLNNFRKIARGTQLRFPPLKK